MKNSNYFNPLNMIRDCNDEHDMTWNSEEESIILSAFIQSICQDERPFKNFLEEWRKACIQEILDSTREEQEEQQRRDEKNGLYNERQDDAN